MEWTELTLHNFRCHVDLTVSLSTRTVIRGHNATGKSSLAEAIIWCLYGTDRTGVSKQDERLQRRGAGDMAVSLTGVTDDGQTVRITRSKDQSQVLQVGGKRQGAQQKIEGFCGTLPEFLTMCMPGYFSSLEPKAARTVLSRCLPVLEKKDVLPSLLPDQRDILSTDRYPMIDGVDGLDFILEKTRRELRATEEAATRLQGEIYALDGVLEQELPVQPNLLLTPERREERAHLQAQVDAKAQVASTKAARLAALHAKRESLLAAYETCKAQWQLVADTCPTCQQGVPADRLSKLRLAATAHNTKLRQQMEELIGQGQAIKAQLEALRSKSDDTSSDALLKAKLAQIQIDEQRDFRAIAEFEARCAVRRRAQLRVKEANQALSSALRRQTELREQLVALDAYRFAYLRLQHERLQEAFTHVRIELVDANRETGEIRSVFRILWQGRPYRTLSQSEKVRCDVEIGRVIAHARRETMPVFVDNAEAVEDLFAEAFSGQVIAAYVDDCALTVESLANKRVSA